ncbi:MFS transporter [Streptomyces sp. NBC_01803]|uniref:MFS transporter n=1 Tax=Streptomyces sp. NBC_01803 TaxID=2975946 RepID=UPI002DD8E4B2|nr:MFS transporter [Streptomyces sp. NBC_01803]WSA43627.1 MFS transporter [Streptomyces sp. NBC_01803]
MSGVSPTESDPKSGVDPTADPAADPGADPGVEPASAGPVEGFDRLRYAGVFVLLFLFGTETFLISPLLPTISDDIGVSEAAAASSVTAYVLAYAVAAPFLGLLSDRFGRRRALLAGTALFAVSNAAAALSTSLALLVVSRALAGLAAAAAGPAIWAHISESTSDRVRGRALGLGMALFSCGQVVGVPLGGLLAGVAGWRSAFWALTLGTAAAVPLLLRQVGPAAGRGVPVGAIRGVLAAWRVPALREGLLVNTAFNAANLGAYTFLGALLVDRFDLSVEALGLVGVLVGAGSVAGSLLGGRLGDRFRAAGRTDLPLLGLWGLLLAAGIAVAATGPGLVLALAGVTLWFVASGGFVTDQQTLAGTAAPELRATSSAWLTSTMYAGTGLGAWAVGAFGDVADGVLAVGAGLAVLAALGGLLVGRGARAAVSRPAGQE